MDITIISLVISAIYITIIIFINIAWSRTIDKLNVEWAELCKRISSDWGAFYYKATQAQIKLAKERDRKMEQMFDECNLNNLSWEECDDSAENSL